jgi:hypothetical protein
MKKESIKKQMKIRLMQPEEMLLIRAGGKKPDDPKSPDEGIMLI